MRTEYCTWEQFENMKETDRLEAHVPYAVGTGRDLSFCWSPDGVGVYWYETITELVENHG